MLAALAMLGAWIPGVDSVVAYLGESFAGVGQAILAGRWDVAGAILMAKLRLVITEGWNSILSVWTGFGVVLGNVWDSIVFGIRATWRSAVTEIAKWLVWVAEKAGFSMEGVQEELDRMRKSDQAADDRSKTTREQSRYKAGGDAIAAGEARAKQIRDEIAGLENEASGCVRSGRSPTLEDVAADAKKALDDAIKNAQDASEQPADARQFGALASGGVQQLGKVASFGTFTAAGAGALAFGFDDKPQQDTARNTKRMVTLMERQKANESKFG